MLLKTLEILVTTTRRRNRSADRTNQIWKIVEDFDGGTYRAVYTAAFPEVVYVLDAFMKKSKTGIKTPQADEDRVLARFKAAEQDYLAHRRRKGGQ